MLMIFHIESPQECTAKWAYFPNIEMDLRLVQRQEKNREGRERRKGQEGGSTAGKRGLDRNRDCESLS